MATPINTIYSWFETGDFPTQAQFQASWSSFWHKDETIPMTTIDGLSEQFGKYVLVSTFESHLNDQNAHPYLAKKNAANLSPTNINDWRTKLGVEDLPDNIATYDYDLPDHVMMKDGTTKEAGDLGKNIANSSLTSLTGAGMNLGAPYVWNTASQPFSITNLPDKSTDNTFNNFITLNSTGKLGKGNGKTVLKAMPSLLTEAEKTAWKTEMNGGWTTNTISVSDIFPPILKLQNQNSYLSVKGANLNLNPANFSISICSVASTSASPIVLAVIDNSQVTLISPTDFAFYYNFNTLGVGEYKLLINNGVSTYLSTYTFLVKNDVDYLDLGNITWNTKTLGDVETSDMQSGGSGILFRPNSLVYPLADEPKTLFKAKTALPLFLAGDDFYLEFNISFTNIGGINSSIFSFGLSSSPDSSTLVNDINKAVSLTLTAGQFITNMSGTSGTPNTSQSVGIVFIKRGTYIIIQSKFVMHNGSLQQKTETISDTDDLYFTGLFQNMDSTSKTFNIAIISAYKF